MATLRKDWKKPSSVGHTCGMCGHTVELWAYRDTDGWGLGYQCGCNDRDLEYWPFVEKSVTGSELEEHGFNLA